ncbi:MAG TPA: oligoribonuclease [Polyangiales bacterium]|nr:oligoribonuclease [Polyangiales bacterium]
MSEETAPSKPALPNLIWIDLEMSGLDPDKCVILELACIVTDGELKELGEGIDLVAHQPDAALDAMDDWCTRHHGQSGLTEAVKQSTLNLRAVELRTIEYLKRFTNKGQSPLAGSSVSHDRRFIDKYMPELSAWLHYRTIDVSTVKELVKRWSHGVELPNKRNTHRALDDIRESIEELRYYKDHAFKAKSP